MDRLLDGRLLIEVPVMAPPVLEDPARWTTILPVS